MKLRAGQKVHYDSGPNMTPLVDIVMVILIFLMLTASFVAGEWWLQSNMPLVQKGADNAAVPKDYVPDMPIQINVESTGEKTWSASIEGRPEHYRTRKELADYLKEMRERLLAASQQPDKIQVYIRPTRTTRHRHTIEAYGAAMDADLKKIAFMMAEK
jgi:biopolymer transport protein ExbD